MKAPYGNPRITSLPGMLSVLSWQPRLPARHLPSLRQAQPERLTEKSAECWIPDLSTEFVENSVLRLSNFTDTAAYAQCIKNDHPMTTKPSQKPFTLPPNAVDTGFDIVHLFV